MIWCVCVFVSVVEGVYVCECWCKGKVCVGVKVECVNGVNSVKGVKSVKSVRGVK